MQNNDSSRMRNFFTRFFFAVFPSQKLDVPSLFPHFVPVSSLLFFQFPFSSPFSSLSSSFFFFSFSLVSSRGQVFLYFENLFINIVNINFEYKSLHYRCIITRFWQRANNLLETCSLEGRHTYPNTIDTVYAFERFLLIEYRGD